MGKGTDTALDVMRYLNVDTRYFSHPKTRRLVGLLGRGSEVLPIKLWSYCGDYHFKDGRLAGYSAQAIEDIIGWWGKPGEAMTALVNERFVDQVEGVYQVHDWLEHEGHILMLHEKARTAAKERWKKHRERCSEHATGIAGALPEHCLAGGRLVGMVGTPNPDPERAREEANARIERMRPKLLEMFCRKPDELIVDYMDQQALCEISRRPECESELEELKAFQVLKESFFPQSLTKLLQTWSIVLDRSRIRKKHGSNQPNNKQGPNRNSGTLNDPSRYSAENLRKLPNYHGPDAVRIEKPGAP